MDSRKTQNTAISMMLPGHMAAGCLHMTWQQLAQRIFNLCEPQNTQSPGPALLANVGAAMGYEVDLSQAQILEGKPMSVGLFSAGLKSHEFHGDDCFSLASQFLLAEVMFNACYYPFEGCWWKPEDVDALCSCACSWRNRAPFA